ncbi:MAG: GNAT family N-acetyltransferase [Candidatus Nanohalobium sp.]
MFLESEDVALRPVEEKDLEFYRELCLTEEAKDGMGVFYPSNMEDIQDGFEAKSKKENIVEFIIEYKGEKAGHVSIHKEGSCCDWRIYVTPEKTGQGIGTTAGELIIDYAFNQLEVHRFEGNFLEDNHASRKLHEKLGFKHESTKRDFLYLNGEHKDLIVNSILREEWNK